jgi:hypothetical protein
MTVDDAYPRRQIPTVIDRRYKPIVDLAELRL